MAVDSLLLHPETTDADSISDLSNLLRETMECLKPTSTEISSVWADSQVTIQQLRVMMILQHDGATRVSALARKLGVSTPTATGILDRLVRQGLICRMNDPLDRRAVLNNLTATGRELVEQLAPTCSDRTEAAIARLSPSERSQLRESLNALLDAVVMSR